MEKPNPMTPRPEGETMMPYTLPAAIEKALDEAFSSDEPTTTPEEHRLRLAIAQALNVTPPVASGGAVGEEDRAWLNCELLRFLNCYKSPTPGSLADMALVQGQKEGALRYFFEAVCNRFAERSAAVRRAAEQGRRDGISECVAAMRSYVAESEQIAANHRGNSDIAVAFQDKADALDAASNRLAALADDEGRGR